MATRSSKSQPKKLLNFLSRHKKHLFPVIILVLVFILTASKLSGTSLGIYESYLYGDGSKDPNLILGKPQGIRSDEWLVTSQLTIAQSENNYTQTNPNFIQDKNMSILSDVPYLDWSIIFKAQNIGFFIIPTEYAFALRWWFLLAILLISAYYFALKFLPNKIILSIFLSIIAAFSPFVFWWYQTGTVGSLAYGFLILNLVVNLIDINSKKFKTKKTRQLYILVNTAVLAYSLTAFAFLLYPPFQIPIALVIAFFSVGYLLNRRFPFKNVRTWLKTLLPILCAGIIAGILCGLFIATRMEAIKATTETVYPGKRDSSSGGYDLERLLVPYLQPQLQRDERGAKYIQNQSESSTFVLLPTFFLIPSIAVFMWLYRKRNKFDWVLLALILCNLLFLAHLFLPIATPITKLFLLGLVPQTRLIIGLGFLAIILTLYIMRVLGPSFRPKKHILIGIILYTGFFLAVSIWAGILTSRMYPDFISSKLFILLLACALIIPHGFILAGRYLIGIGFIMLFSLASVVFIHPLYRGLGPIYNSEITRTIKSVSTEQDVWGAVDQIYIENIPQLSDRRAVSGVSTYPSVDFWEKHTTDNLNSIYNRYAHVVMTSSNDSELELIQPDLFLVSGACDRKIMDTIDYLLSATPLDSSCYKLIKTVLYPARTFYIYQVTE